MKKLLLMLMLMAPLATFAQKFGKVNTQTIMQNLPEIAKINGELQATAKQYENDLKGMQDELKRQSDAYDKAKSTMNPTAPQQDKMKPVVEKVRKAIENVGKAGGFTYIFEEGAAVYTGTNVEDVTAKVQAEINKMK